MRSIITNNTEKCVGCNRCIRVCPIEEANIAQEIDSKIVVKIDTEKCIACGACIAACPHGVRAYEDDTERFFNDLKSGVKISLFTAPALKTNFDEWSRILTWLRELGIYKVFDVSLGADICTWAHIRYLQKNADKHIITQPCPAIVNYIQKYRPTLLENLSPVHSPMLCTAVYMHKYEGIDTKIAALSPCIAKSHEFEATGLVEYNITLSKLHDYIKHNVSKLPASGSGFDHYESGLGFLYPMPGGLKENVEYYLGKSVRIDKSEGQQTVYKTLDEYAQQPIKNLPVIFDVLNCAEGCNHGTGCLHENKSVFEIQTNLDTARQQALSDNCKDYLEKLYEQFDRTLNLDDFIRRYSAYPVRQLTVSNDAVENAFIQLNKLDEDSRNYNCGACGCYTCHEMAIKIAKGVNTPLNCMEKAHKDIALEHAETIKTQTENIENLNTIMEDILRIKGIMEDIVSNMDNVTCSITGFNRMSDSIQKTAMQIKIISLNASIEAAKAGESGKAFGVVAEEIRDLANRSRISVETAETTSTQATHSISLIAERIAQISKSINQFYTDVALISENTNKIINKR